MEIQQSISEHKTSTGFVSSRRGRARIGTSPSSERWDVLHRPRRWQRKGRCRRKVWGDFQHNQQTRNTC